MNPLDALSGLESVPPQVTGQPRPSVPGFDDLFELSLMELLPGGPPAEEDDDLDDEDDDGAWSREDRTVSLSPEAEKTIHRRGLRHDDDIADRLSAANDALQLRGSRHALVLSTEQAWRLDVQERVVTHAWTRSEALGQVFADLDSTTVIPDR